MDQELEDYNVQLVTFNSRRHSVIEPKKLTIYDDRLTPTDWSIIAQYTQILRPLKLATMRLQGHVKELRTSAKVVIGSLWMVLPIYEEILSSFEEARERHPTVAKQRSRLSQATTTRSTPPSSPRTTPSPGARRMTQSSQIYSQGPSAASGNKDTTPNDDVIAEEQSVAAIGSDNDPSEISDFESHFSTNLNLG